MIKSREIAVNVLTRVEKQEAFAAAALEAELGRLTDQRDISLASELVLGVLRRRSWLDHLLNSASKKGLGKIDPNVRNILRVGAYQLAFLERVPARAAVSEAVKQTNDSRAPKLKGLVNALLRNLATRGRDAITPISKETDNDDAIAMREGLPLWVFKRLATAHGKEFAFRAANAFNEPSPRTLRICTNKISREAALERLGEMGTPCKYSPWSVNVSTRSAARALIEDGLAVFQDEGASLVALALDPKPQDNILDACAGRGGKTGTLALITNGQAKITAIDLHSSKLDRLNFELKKQGFSAAVEALNLIKDTVNLTSQYDRILLDAPCTGTGTMGRRPEIRWRLTEKGVKSLVAVQMKMLHNVANLVAPGGHLVYAVCSLIQEECEGHLKPFLSKYPEFKLVKNAPEQWPEAIPWNNGKPLIDPGISKTDGYSMLCLRKES